MHRMSTYDSKGYAPDEREENVGGTATDCPDMPCPDMPELQKAESEGINEPSSINSDLQVEMPEYDPDEQMRHALGDMMHLSTPVLDMVRVILTLPAFIVAKLLLHPIFLYSMGMAALDKLIAGQLDACSLDVVKVFLESFLLPDADFLSCQCAVTCHGLANTAAAKNRDRHVLQIAHIPCHFVILLQFLINLKWF